jgi:hypothetical protein
MAPKARPEVITLTERFDYGALSYIIDNFAVFRFRPETDSSAALDTIRRYKASSADDGSLRVSYQRLAHNHGRFFAHKGMSMQGMPREIRNAIGFRIHHDLDFKNCHPTLLLQYARRNVTGFPCPRLEEYVADRAPLVAALQEGASAPGAAKAAVLAVINGGAVDSPKRGIDMKNRGALWLRELGGEMSALREAIVALPGSPYLGLARKSLAKKKTAEGAPGNNLLGSAVNHLLCDLENEALMALREFIEAESGLDRRVGVLVFDGCMVERRPTDRDVAIAREALDAASDFVFRRTGFRLHIALKDMAADKLDVPMSAYSAWGFASVPQAPEYAVDDVSAARLFLKDIGPISRSCNARVFYRVGVVWTDAEAVVDKEMLARCLESNIVRPDTDATISGNVPTARRVVIAAKALMPDDATFQALMWRSNIGVICYTNGLWDFKARRFFAYEERPDVYPALVVPRAFPVERPSEALVAEVRQRLLLSTLGAEDVVDTYLALIARATAGDYADKQWAVMLGERNCGKGLLQEVNEGAWGPYVNTVNSGAFLVQNFAAGDAAKAMSWAMDCEHKRQTYTNEVKCDVGNRAIKLDGNVLKNFQSGGDSMSARKNYCDERAFRVASKLIMNVNDLPEVTPRDALSTMIMFKFPFKFVTEADMAGEPPAFFRPRDETLKTEFCKRDDVRDAFTWLVIDAYADRPVAPCASVRADTQGYLEDVGDDLTLILRHFKATGKSTDAVTLRQIMDFSVAHKSMSTTIIKDRLVRMGGRYSGNCRVARGVRLGKGYMGVAAVAVDPVDVPAMGSSDGGSSDDPLGD